MADSRAAADKRARLRFPPVIRIAAILGLFVVVGVAVWALQGGIAVAPDVPRVGGPAPSFTLQDAGGQSVSLASLRGKPVIINFWATWCPPCKAEMPAISAVARANPDAVVLAVDVLEGPALVKDYIQQLDLAFVPLLDPTGEVAGHYRVSSLPSSFFIGPDGAIRAINIGPLDQPAIEQNLRRARS